VISDLRFGKGLQFDEIPVRIAEENLLSRGIASAPEGDAELF
jgi:hypothetical protein